MQLVFGMLLLIAGLAVTDSALPLMHRFVRVLPEWSLSRGQVDQLASTTFLTAFVGLLMVVAGLMMKVVAVVPS